MILQTLAEYHCEQVAIGNLSFAPNGMELKRIHFVLVLSVDGLLIDIEKLEDKVCVAKSRERGGKDAPLIANRMWDNIGYVAGYGADEKRKKAAIIQHRSFVEQVRAIHREYPKNRSFTAVDKFYSRHIEQLYNHRLWEDIISKSGYNLSFRLTGELLLASEQKEITADAGVTKYGQCVVLGDKTKIAHTHPKIHIPGCSPTGAKLVSFTNDSGYDSYLKKGSDNAPVSIGIVESYTSALTGLIQAQSSNSFIVGDVTIIFFTLPTTDFSELFSALLRIDPKMDRQKVLRELKNNIHNQPETEFILMALVPNAARISIRLYVRSSVEKVSANILRYYQQMSLDNNFNFDNAMTMLSPIFGLSRYDNAKNLPPQLIVDFVEAIVCGGRFPVLIHQNSLKRLREKPERSFVIYSILKSYLIRNSKIHISMSLDTENRDTGYVLGRLLAISERAQELYNPNVNFTIRDTFYNTLSVTPSFVFNRFISSTGVFIRRIPTKGANVYIKTQFGAVMEMLDGKVPVHFSLDQQSCFALGYFHQRQTYFKKREPNEQDS